MKKKIGIIGGISSASTIQYYRTITDLYFKQFNNYYYPEIIIDSLDFQYFTDLENENKKQEYIDYIVRSTNNLEKAGAGFIIMAANSPHSVFEEVKKQTNLPMISIVDTAAVYALKNNLKKVLLTGIKYTMQSDFYPKGFNKLGIEVVIPSEEHKSIINDIIFSELVINKFLNETKKQFLGIINSYYVDGVILGCTELPLLVNQNDTNIKLLDTLSLHCDAALQFCINE
ncbi:MAG: amino acid racemase [Synergistaceae bacterium]|nr:amino acid racemase [Synergistaceae bacterium]